MAQEQNSHVANMMARNAITSNAVKQLLPITSKTMPLTSGALSATVETQSPTPTGMQLGFYLLVKANITNNTGGVLTRAPYGATNLLQNIKYRDLGNQPRSDVSGKMLHFLMSQKSSAVFGATIAPDTGTAPSYGDWGVNKCPATIASGASADISMMFYLPLSYSEYDLRGAVFGQIAQANQAIQMTFPTNGQLIASSTENPVDAVYQSASATKAVTINSFAYDLKMSTYGHGLPMSNGQYVVPLNDVSTVYAITETTVTGLTVGQQFSIPYPNAWEYLSTIGLFVNGSQLNAGTDITDLEIKTASGISFGAVTPEFHAFTTGLRLKVHPPVGMYFDSHHQKSIQVEKYGAISYNVRPSLVNANASFRLGYEFFERLANFQAVGMTM